MQTVTAAMKLKSLTPWKKIYDNLDSILKRREVKSKGEKEKYKHLNAEF